MSSQVATGVGSRVGSSSLSKAAVHTGTDSTLITEDVCRHVSESLRTAVKLPWESNPVLNPNLSSFGSRQNLKGSTVGLADFMRNMVCHSTQVSTAAPAFSRSAKRAKLATCIVSPDDLRHRSLTWIKIMVETDLHAATFGQNIFKSTPPASYSHVVNASLNDALANKSTATLYKRVRAFWGMFVWIRSSSRGTGMDIKESMLYDYLTHLKQSQRGATSGESFLQSVMFFHSVLGFVSLEPDRDISARVKGVAHHMYVRKPTLVQARPLHVSELRALEAAVLQEEQFHVVVIAGYLLFCLMAVCRFSDAMHAQDLSISQSGKTVLVEAGTNVHKTAHTKERKTMLLPLVALGHVLDSERSWAVRWMEVRQQQKLDKEEVILPAFSEQRGCWLDRPMSTAEGMLWLRDIVQLRCPSGETLTTHSLKTTLLAWSTMFGVLDFQQRRTLGHHVDAGVASPLTYGRDNVAVLQVAIARMLRAIVAHRFNPDLSRAARIDKEIEVLTAELDENHKLVAYGPLDTDDVSDIEEAEAVEEAVGQAELGGRIYIAAAKANGRIKQHRVSGILHFVGANEKLACGRKVSSFYRNIDSDLNHEWPICQQCRHVIGEEMLSTYLEG